jgi:hypothetical protein
MEDYVKITAKVQAFYMMLQDRVKVLSNVRELLQGNEALSRSLGEQIDILYGFIIEYEEHFEDWLPESICD